jgi:hypothetical protein
MTEHDWLVCDDIEVMLHFLDGKVPVRKQFLFDLACCRRIWHLVPDDFRQGLMVGERFVDGLVTRDELEQAVGATLRALRSLPREWRGTDGLPGRRAAYADEPFRQACEPERRAQLALLRHIVGNPFQPVHPPASRPAATVTLGEALYNGTDAAFALRDALLESGETEFAEHFREANHPKGCAWLDAIMGK